MNSMTKDGSTRIPRAWGPFPQTANGKKDPTTCQEALSTGEVLRTFHCHPLSEGNPERTQRTSTSVHKKTKIEH